MTITPEHKSGSAMPQSGAVPHHHISAWTNSTGVDHLRDAGDSEALIEKAQDQGLRRRFRLAPQSSPHQ
jgi:hypothetical protein